MAIPEERYVDITRPGSSTGGVPAEIRELQRRLDAHIGKGGNAHAIATPEEDGFMSQSDKEKFDTVQRGATQNQTDEYLLSLANATGDLPIARVDGLQEEIDRISGDSAAQLREDLANDVVGDLGAHLIAYPSPEGESWNVADLANPDLGPAMVGYGDYPEYAGGVGKAIQEARRELLPAMQDISAFKNAYSRRHVDKFATLRARSPAGRAYIWKNPTLVAGGENYRFSLGVNMSGYRTAEWDFISDVDGYYRLRYGRTGPIRPPSLAINATSFSQDPILVGDNAYFSATSGMGASFTVDFEGTGLITNHYVDNRGGVFSVIVDGGAPFFISTHESNPENAGAVGASISKLIASGLHYGQHSAVFTFIGDDPNYSPAGGASRGWFKYENGTAPEAYTANVITGSEMGLAATGTRISANGILDFAISGRPVDSSFDSSWVPSHGSASGSILVTSRKIYLNEMLLDDNLSTINSEVEIKEFTLTQTYLAYNTNDASHTTPMWEGEITTKFTRERGLEFFHDLTFLADTEIAEGYMAMCSGRRTAGYTRVEFDNGASVDISGPTPGAIVTHNPGMAQSAAWLGSTAGLALSVPYVEASAGIGRASAAAQTMLLTERTDDFVKCYYRMCEQGAVLAAGTRLCSAHAIWLGTF